MPNWEELAKGMNQPFAPMQQAPGADPNFKPTLDPVTVWNALQAVGQYFGNAVKQPIQGTMDAARMGHYNVAPGQPVSIDPMNPLTATMMGIGAGWKGGLPAGATGVGMTFKERYPSFDVYKARMEEMKIPLDLLAKEKAKGLYKEVPANEAEYLARAGGLYAQYLAKMKSEGRTPTLTEKDFAKFEKPVAGQTTDLISSIRSLQPKGQGRALVSISELRDKVGMTPAEFDAQLIKLAQEGKVALHQHDFASSLKPEERAKLLAIPNPNAYWGGKDFYVGVVPKEK